MKPLEDALYESEVSLRMVDTAIAELRNPRYDGPDPVAEAAQQWARIPRVIDHPPRFVALKPQRGAVDTP